MKQITKNTTLKKGDKTFQPVEVDGVIYWINPKKLVVGEEYNDIVYNKGFVFKTNRLFENFKEVVAQSQPKLEGIPIISLDDYVKPWYKKANELYPTGRLERNHTEQEAFREGVKWKELNPNQYTQQDIEKVIELSGLSGGYPYSKKEIFQKINSISLIEVDKQFNILSYE